MFSHRQLSATLTHFPQSFAEVENWWSEQEKLTPAGQLFTLFSLFLVQCRQTCTVVIWRVRCRPAVWSLPGSGPWSSHISLVILDSFTVFTTEILPPKLHWKTLLKDRFRFFQLNLKAGLVLRTRPQSWMCKYSVNTLTARRGRQKCLLTSGWYLYCNLIRALATLLCDSVH